MLQAKCLKFNYIAVFSTPLLYIFLIKGVFQTDGQPAKRPRLDTSSRDRDIDS